MLKNGKSLDFKRFSGIEKVHRNSIRITVDLMVELRGVEPLSESALTRPSPGAGQIQDSRPVQALPRLHGLVES